MWGDELKHQKFALTEHSVPACWKFFAAPTAWKMTSRKPRIKVFDKEHRF